MASDDEAFERDHQSTAKAGDRRAKRKPCSNDFSRHKSRLNRRKVKSYGDFICPVCHLTIRQGEVDAHFEAEIKKIEKSFKLMSDKLVAIRGSGSSLTSTDNLPSIYRPLSSDLEGNSSSQSRSGCTSNPIDDGPFNTMTEPMPSTSHSTTRKRSSKQYKDPGADLFKRTRINRLMRLQSKRWQVKELPEEAICPVCEEPVLASSIPELQFHVEKCLRKQDGEESSDEEIDVEGDSYEWCGMKRVRITSILKAEGQLDALGTMVEKGDEEANVEVCLLQDSEDYGPPQYFENDLSSYPEVDHNGNEGVENEASNAQLPNSCSSNPSASLPPEAASGDAGMDSENNHLDEYSLEQTSSCSASQFAFIKALRVKMEELEERGTFICHICHGPYNVPLVSVVCWHVHCEKCWLQALSTQKLCPQCKVIVSPSGLRKIFL